MKIKIYFERTGMVRMKITSNKKPASMPTQIIFFRDCGISTGTRIA